MKIRLMMLLAGTCVTIGAAAQESAVTGAAAPEAADTLSTPGYELLDEVVVQAERPVMQTDGAKLTYNVDEDPAAGSSSAMDILKKVPQVSVDGDGNVRLNGSTAFKFQLNGLDNPMLKQYAQQIFEAMPASAIVKIEVITEPGAREDAEGTAGIINIITERTRRQDGYSGQVSLRADNRSLTPSVYAVAKKDKVTVSANVNYQWGFSPQKFEQDINTRYLTEQNPGLLHTKVGQESKHQFIGGNINMSWEPNPDNLFTAGANMFYVNGRLPKLYGLTEFFATDATAPLWSFSQDGNGSLKVFNISANASYRHNFGHEGNHLVLSYLFNFGRNSLGLHRWFPETFNYEPGYDYYSQQSLTFDRGHTVQIDYGNDFHSEHHLLEVGAKGIFRHNSALAIYTYSELAGMSAGIPDEDSDIMQPQNIYAAYAAYTGSFNKLGVAAGLRYEHTLLGVTNRLDSREDFRSRLNDWVPNAALTWNFSAATNLRLAYQMRISRPSIEQVNPFELSFTPYQINTGNPDLTSERIHILSLKYSSFGRVLGGTIGVEYNLADNAISSFTYLEDRNGINTVVTSYANIGKRQNVALSGLLTWSIIKGMNLSATGRLAYNKLSAPAEGFRNHGWSGEIGANWVYSVADVYKFSAYGSWNSRSLQVQGYQTGYYYYGISAARDFLADRSLTLSLSANNFLQQKMTFKNHTETPGIIYDSTARNLRAWSIGISLSWKFGSLKAQVKKTGVEVSNDDINSSSNKGQGGGAI